jgi:hypothetical protein
MDELLLRVPVLLSTGAILVPVAKEKAEVAKVVTSAVDEHALKDESAFRKGGVCSSMTKRFRPSLTTSGGNSLS